VLLSLFRPQAEKYLAVIGAIGFTSLVLIRATIESDVRKEAISVKFEQGYYLATILLLASTVMNAIIAARTHTDAPDIPVQAGELSQS
jgi:hypothetical protein